eukprot:GHVS01082502.1.p1 GENE.GHVS01082502.1~~GHVS01082502.1.p1  ORF type:complete len:515 (-),score=188.02 GHVS01082502.1:187-1731(-)
MEGRTKRERSGKQHVKGSASKKRRMVLGHELDEVSSAEEDEEEEEDEGRLSDISVGDSGGTSAVVPPVESHQGGGHFGYRQSDRHEWTHMDGSRGEGGDPSSPTIDGVRSKAPKKSMKKHKKSHSSKKHKEPPPSHESGAAPHPAPRTAATTATTIGHTPMPATATTIGHPPIPATTTATIGHPPMPATATTIGHPPMPAATTATIDHPPINTTTATIGHPPINTTTATIGHPPINTTTATIGHPPITATTTATIGYAPITATTTTTTTIGNPPMPAATTTIGHHEGAVHGPPPHGLLEDQQYDSMEQYQMEGCHPSEDAAAGGGEWRGREQRKTRKPLYLREDGDTPMIMPMKKKSAASPTSHPGTSSASFGGMSPTSQLLPLDGGEGGSSEQRRHSKHKRKKRKKEDGWHKKKSSKEDMGGIYAEEMGGGGDGHHRHQGDSSLATTEVATGDPHVSGDEEAGGEPSSYLSYKVSSGVEGGGGGFRIRLGSHTPGSKSGGDAEQEEEDEQTMG